MLSFSIHIWDIWFAIRFFVSRLESALSEMCRLLKVIFRVRYFNVKSNPESVSKRYAEAIKDSQSLLRESLYHYQQYLTIKAQRNITMTTYLEDFPGLVHFIHVDRKTDQITAPSISVSGVSYDGIVQSGASSLVKEKVSSVNHSQIRFDYWLVQWFS